MLRNVSGLGTVMFVIVFLSQYCMLNAEPSKLDPNKIPSITELMKTENIRLAIQDIGKNFPEQYNAAKMLEKLEKFEARFKDVNLRERNLDKKYESLRVEYEQFRREALLSNPLLKFDKVLVRVCRNLGMESNWMSCCTRGKGDGGKNKYDNYLGVISISNPESDIKPLIQAPRNSFIGDVCLKWDAKTILVTALSDKNTWEVFEVNLDKPTEFKQISPFMGNDVNNVEGIFIPDGSYLFISDASMMGVPCIGGSGRVGNIFRVEKDLKTCRQLTFEQDQDWCPTLLNNGRVMYLRWEYVDINHYFTRIMMHMNPDGTNQIEYYGSGSYWPNSMFYAKAIPGHSSRFVTVVTGHHDVPRQGELHLIDPKLGRKEAEGAVHQFPFKGRKVEGKILDNLVGGSWPRFTTPCPLNENYYLVSCKPKNSNPYGLYLVDKFDNLLLIKELPDGLQILEPNALVEKPMPPVLPDRTIKDDKKATVFITDLYFGPGLENVPVGTVKKLRVFTYQYGYRGIGNHDAMGQETSWDSKILLGEVPVYGDGSANFEIPSNMPIALQPLDKDGNALQLMRSWLVGMPGERVTCTGCHENQNSVTPNKLTVAGRRPSDKIEDFNGPKRPMGFTREVQPVLEKYCVGCHNGEKPNRPNFADTSLGPRGMGKSYWALMPYLRRPGPESDTHMFYPMEYHSNTSPLIQMLRDGNHYNVKLDETSSRELSLWIDMNMPFHATWTEVAYSTRRGNTSGVTAMAKRTQEMRSLYANVDDNPEEGAMFKPEAQEFVKPAEWITPNTKGPGTKAVVNDYVAKTETVDLGNGVSMTLTRIPSGKFVIGDDSEKRPEVGRNEVVIEKPFYMGTTEVTNAMYKQYNATHDSRFIDQQWKDHVHQGYPANRDDQPVIRVTWEEAQKFCAWLSEKTGKKFRLPTEAEWEWAAKAGTDQPFWWSANFGKATSNDNGRLTGCDVPFADKANFADSSLKLMVVKGVNPQPVNHQPWEAFLPRVMDQNDNQMLPGWDSDSYEKMKARYNGSLGVGRYAPNPWGLYDMNGNVAEWTQSDYKAYPYVANDGRNAGNIGVEKVVRGGSWFDRPAQARNGYRLPFHMWQRVYNVGFRVVCDE